MSTPNDGPDPREFSKRQFGPRDWPASAEVEALEAEESHFTPPRPPKGLPAIDPVRRFAAILTCVGPILAIIALILRAALGATPLITGLLWCGAVFFLAGLIIGLWKMPAHRSAKSDYDDDGAVV